MTTTTKLTENQSYVLNILLRRARIDNPGYTAYDGHQRRTLRSLGARGLARYEKGYWYITERGKAAVLNA